MKKKFIFLLTLFVVGCVIGWFAFIPFLNKLPEMIKNIKTPELAYNGPWATSLKVGGSKASVILRAIIANTGLGANSSDEAVYWLTMKDSAGERLRGGHAYEVRFVKPPAIQNKTGFWSLCVYNSKDYFVPNPMKRYNLGDRSPLVKNADGSFTIYLSPKQPTDANNWLPLPENEEPIVLQMRMYAPLPDVLKQPEKSPMPVVIRVDKR